MWSTSWASPAPDRARPKAGNRSRPRRREGDPRTRRRRRVSLGLGRRSVVAGANRQTHRSCPDSGPTIPRLRRSPGRRSGCGDRMCGRSWPPVDLKEKADLESPQEEEEGIGKGSWALAFMGRRGRRERRRGRWSLYGGGKPWPKEKGRLLLLCFFFPVLLSCFDLIWASKPPTWDGPIAACPGLRRDKVPFHNLVALTPVGFKCSILI